MSMAYGGGTQLRVVAGREGDQMRVVATSMVTLVGRTESGKPMASCCCPSLADPFLTAFRWRHLVGSFSWPCEEPNGGNGVAGDDLSWPDGGRKGCGVLLFHFSGRPLLGNFPATGGFPGSRFWLGGVRGTSISPPVVLGVAGEGAPLFLFFFPTASSSFPFSSLHDAAAPLCSLKVFTTHLYISMMGYLQVNPSPSLQMVPHLGALNLNQLSSYLPLFLSSSQDNVEMP